MNEGTNMHIKSYRSSRAIHVATLKRWRAGMAATEGNPIITVCAHLPAMEVRRANVAQAIGLARQALATLRSHGWEA